VKLLREGYRMAELGECPFSELGAFFDQIKRCTHHPMELNKDGVWVEEETGETSTSYRELAEDWGWPLKNTYVFIQRLQDDGIITTRTTGNMTMISLVY